MNFRKKSILLIGAGGHSRSCIDVIEATQKYRIVGLVGKEDEIGNKVNGYEVIGSDNQLQELSNEYQNAHIAIGQIGDFRTRSKAFKNAASFGFELPSIISPKAYVSSSSDIGKGSMVMHGVVINSGVTIGGNCIINTNALLEHDVKIGSNCHISTGVIINGDVTIGDNTFIGSGAVIRNSINIGSEVFVGMRARVVTNLEVGAKFLGAEI
jgi:sugar O-acyltransferase (sialic acid O-acetyltransferase NeuD family)